MTVNTTYESALSRVKIDITGQPAYADHAVVERSVNGITWTTVRGGDALSLLAGAAVIHDYEFQANVTNTYRVRAVDTGPASVIAAAATAAGVNVTLNPALPASLQRGDVAILCASIRNSGVGTVNLPANWTAIAGVGTNFLVAARDWGAGWAAPAVTFTGGAANQDVLAFIWGGRNVKIPAFSANQILNASAQNVESPAYTGANAGLLSRCGWKQDDATTWTSTVATVALASSTAGDDSSMFAGATVSGAAEFSYPQNTMAVTGGAVAISRGISFSLSKADYVMEETDDIVPPLDTIWLKNVTRPNLNTPLTVVGPLDEIKQESRSGLFYVIGRTNAVAVTEVRGGRETTITATTATLAEEEDLRLRLMTGEPCFLHTPDIAGGCPIPSMYVEVGNVAIRKAKAIRSTRRYFDLPLTEVAPPVSTFVGTTITYGEIASSFATYSDLLLAEPTYSDVLDRTGNPADVVVP